MKNLNYTMVVLEPDNTNGYLTQNDNVDIIDRLFSKKIYLAVNDSAQNYKEITEDEYTTLKEQQDKAIEQKQKEDEDKLKLNNNGQNI